MNVRLEGQTLHILGVERLGGAEGQELLLLAQPSLREGLEVVEIDLSGACSLDGRGLGVLARLCSSLRRQKVQLRLSHAPEPVRRILQLSRLDEVVEVEKV